MGEKSPVTVGNIWKVCDTQHVFFINIPLFINDYLLLQSCIKSFDYVSAKDEVFFWNLSTPSESPKTKSTSRVTCQLLISGYMGVQMLTFFILYTWTIEMF